MSGRGVLALVFCLGCVRDKIGAIAVVDVLEEYEGFSTNFRFLGGVTRLPALALNLYSKV